ncbi:hypothetical protein [uncultured Paracoccus sp.]|uniref:hypothetical protein n=1 Tax=uncultured Paracoccus sp. TaxID=189685 RepID=UPI0025CF15E9|nr:hypothetical protein [uncultured Paracoccus sp.]
MISYRHVVTFGTAQHGWLSNVADLAVAQIGADWMLFAVNATGGVSSHRIGDPLAPMQGVSNAALPLNLTYHGQPSLTVLGGSLLVEGLSGAGVAGLSFDRQGRLGDLGQLFPAEGTGARLSASGQMEGDGGRFLFLAREGRLAIEVSRINPDGSLSPAARRGRGVAGQDHPGHG